MLAPSMHCDFKLLNVTIVEIHILIGDVSAVQGKQELKIFDPL